MRSDLPAHEEARVRVLLRALREQPPRPLRSERRNRLEQDRTFQSSTFPKYVFNVFKTKRFREISTHGIHN